MNNEFDLAALRQHWQQQPVAPVTAPTAADLAEARHRQRQQWYLLLAEWLGALTMGGTAFWLVTSMPSWLSYCAAAFLSVGLLMSGYVSWHVHRPLLTYDNWTSGGVVAFRLRSCQLSLLYARYNQGACAVLMAFVAVLWALWFWQAEQVPTSVLKFYTLIALPLCGYGLYRLQRRIQQQKQALLALQALAADFQQER